LDECEKVAQPLMPRATAIWLIENTCLSFEQIADFCGLHILEINAIADDETNNMVGFDPIASSQLTNEEIKRCENDRNARLRIRPAINIDDVIKTNKAKYTPVLKRRDKPNAILWILKYCQSLSDSQICKLLGTTRLTIQSIRDKTHWNYSNIQPHSPVSLGFCTQHELDQLTHK
jgi:hypothetical protein